jgi:FAD:protein FMN transferase
MPLIRRPAAAELRIRAMGTETHLVVVGGPSRLLAQARRRIDDLERRWSRFRPDSEVSRLNAGSDRPTPTSVETRLLVRCALLGWRRTNGLFDPTVHDALLAAGYDRDLAAVRRNPGRRVGPFRPAPGCAGVAVDDAAGTVTLAEGVRLDPGGIGKGLAADLVVADLLDAGAAGACVNMGGDLRVAGAPPDGHGWRVALPAGAHDPAGTLHLAGGAVATSSTHQRRWTAGGMQQHHLIDPASGVPTPQARTATVVADTGWQAEVAAKVAVLAAPGDIDRLLDPLAVAALITDRHCTRRWGATDRFLEAQVRAAT